VIQLRKNLLQGATAFLYLGPMLAGLAGHDLLVLLPFTLLFVLWVIVMHPADWPRRRDSWGKSDTWVKATAQVAVQLLLVLVCLGIGRGIAGVVGIVLLIPVGFPLSLSLLSIPLCRILLAAGGEAKTEARADPNMPTLDELEVADHMLAPLSELAPYTPTEVLERHLAAMATHVSARALTQSLMTHAASAKAPAVIRRAFVLRATDPAIAVASQTNHAIAGAFQVARKDADLLTVFASRALNLIRVYPQLSPGFPHHSDVTEAAVLAMDANLRRLLTDLADVLELSTPAKRPA
jgi:hypothetical protein